MDRAGIRAVSDLGSMISSRADISLISALLVQSRNLQFRHYEGVELLLELFDHCRGGVIYKRPEEKKYNLEEVQVIVSNRIYWKECAEDSSSQAYSLTDFCNADSLEFNRLNETSWQSVGGTVQAVKRNEKLCIIVLVHLHGPLRRKQLFLASTDKVVLLATVF